MSRKAIFMSIISIVLVASLTYFLVQVNKPSPLDGASATETRVLAMDAQIVDIKTDLERGLRISTVRTILSLLARVSENGTYVPDFDSAFSETMLNGTLEGQPMSLVENSTVTDWATRVSSLAENLDLDLSITIQGVTAVQASPWEVEVRLIGEMNLTDTKGVAAWQRSLNISTNIPIEGLEDPIYSLASQGKYANLIHTSNITVFVVGENGTGLMTQANNSWYIASAIAPSYLMRFEGDLSESPYGIESVVNIERMRDAAPSSVDEEASSVDYIQFGSREAGCLLNQTQELDWLRLDTTHLAVYGATCRS